MSLKIRELHGRNIQFIGLIMLTLIFIGLYISAEFRLAQREGASWRRIDLDTLLERIETGELRDREASWYHAVDNGDKTPMQEGGRP